MTSSSSQNLTFRPEINGLRAIAVLLVIVFHLDKSWMPFGYVGVDIFFVISGFLITRIILREQTNGDFKLGNFIARRIKRILPALFFILLICSLLSILILSSEEYRYFFRSLRYTSAQASNFFFLGNSGYFDLDSKFNVLLHTWSLGVEEQFYLVWPLLLLIVAKLRISRTVFFVIIASCSFGSMWYFKNIESMHYFFMFYARAWEFAIGGFLATGILRPNNNKTINQTISVASMLCILVPLFYASSSNQSELYYLLLTCIGVAGIIYSSMTRQTFIAKLLSYKLLLLIGLLSYSLYLWHWPVIVFYNYVIEFSLASKGLEVPAMLDSTGVIIILTITCLLSMLTYKYIEKPYRSAKTGNKRLFVLSIVCIASFMGLAKLGQKQTKASWRLNTFSEHVSINDLEINISRSYDLEESPEDIIITGDSHSEHFTPMIETWSKKHNLQSKTIYKGATPPLLVYDQFQDFLTYRQKLHLDRVRDYILQSTSIKHVFLAANHYDYQDNPQYEKALSDTIQLLIKHKKSVCLLGQTPALTGNGIRFIEPTHLMNWLFPKQLSNETLLAFDADLVNSKSSPMREIMARLKQQYPTIQLWHPEKYIDSGLQEGLPCYSDKGHLNKHGSLYLAPYFKYELKPASQ